jgi:hypothetical protein
VLFARRFLCGNANTTMELAKAFGRDCSMQGVGATGYPYEDSVELANALQFKRSSYRFFLRVLQLAKYRGDRIDRETFVVHFIIAQNPLDWKLPLPLVSMCMQLGQYLVDVSTAYARGVSCVRPGDAVASLLSDYLKALGSWKAVVKASLEDMIVHTLLLRPSFFFDDGMLDGTFAKMLFATVHSVGPRDVARMQAAAASSNWEGSVSKFLQGIAGCLKCSPLLPVTDFESFQVATKTLVCRVASINDRHGRDKNVTLRDLDTISDALNSVQMPRAQSLWLAMNALYRMARNVMVDKANLLILRNRRNVKRTGVWHEKKRFSESPCTSITEGWIKRTVVLDLYDGSRCDRTVFCAVMSLVVSPPALDAVPETMRQDLVGILELSRTFHGFLSDLIVSTTLHVLCPGHDDPPPKVLEIVQGNLLKTSTVYPHSLERLSRLWIEHSMGYLGSKFSVALQKLLPKMKDSIATLAAIARLTLQVHGPRYSEIVETMQVPPKKRARFGAAGK